MEKKRCHACEVPLVSIEDRVHALHQPAKDAHDRWPTPVPYALLVRSDDGSLGFVCPDCGTTFCMGCVLELGEAHSSGAGMACLLCGEKLASIESASQLKAAPSAHVKALTAVAYA